MKKRLLYLIYSLLFFLPALASAQTATHLVISEIYGAGGNTGAVYNSDFIELYNPTSADVDISGWSVQYNSATGTGAFSGITVFPTGSIVKAHGFFLVQEQSGGSAGIALPTPDMATTGVINNFNLSGTAGKVALVNNGTIIAAKPTL
ncbi:MAG: lamin tail domain-containing protein, partial [Mucilaginibacter sp.]|uniref:lamin tail domain-containing protein n=1 Tax=Mucilaginibacter sp. TaxID=1882438 RepID=UPI003266B11A